MTNFAYVAVDEQGKEISGVLQAESRNAAMTRLRSQGMYPMSVQQAGAGAAPTAKDAAGSEVLVGPRKRSWRITGADLTIFTRQLASLFNAGLSMARSIDTLIEHAENQRMATILEQVRRTVAGGNALWESLAEHPKVFSELYVNLVRAGEASGQLGNVLERLADDLEVQEEQRSRIRQALAYPVMVLLMTGAVVAFAFLYMIPQFQGIFGQMGRDLPAPTQVILALSEFLSSYGLFVLLGIVGAVVGLRWLDTTERGGLALDRFRMRLPVMGSIIHKDAVSRFCRTLSTLVGGGVPILTSFEVSERAVGNRVIRQAITQVRDAVREGETLAQPLRRSGAFPALVTNMIAVGEETGNLDEMLRRVADTYDAEVQNRLRQALALLEPGIIIVMGLIVGTIVIAMLLPVLQMSTGM